MQWSNIAFQAAETGLNNTIKNNNWASITENSTLATSSYEGSSHNIDYNSISYFVEKTELGRTSAEQAWDASVMGRANFTTRSTGVSKVETDDRSGDTLAQVILEETNFIVAPK